MMAGPGITNGNPPRSLGSQRGVSLLETLVAVTILLVVLAGLVPLAGSAIATTEGQDQVARTVEYAQDKMEQLLSLPYGDATTNTGVFPSSATGGSGLAAGGGVDPSAPQANYVDYLDANGAYLTFTGTTPPAGWAYCRLWQIEDNSTVPSLPANLKRITVTVRMLQTGLLRPVPQSTLTTLKSAPF